ncbi:unnamed protein product [Auanema sp. JU1783]|nr:unnamed protein product [Auanema sp. JU1783]
MSAMFRAILIGNFLTSNFLQIFCSLGTMPSILLPCFALYTNGLMNYTGMSTIVQVHITGVIFSFSGWLVVFICLLRALAVSVYLTEQQKTQITFAYIIFSLLNLFPLAAMGDKLRFSGDDKLSCSEMFNSQPPPELFMSETVVSQHKLTLGVLKLAFFQSMGTTVPPIAVMFCIMNAIPSRTASEILMILLTHPCLQRTFEQDLLINFSCGAYKTDDDA